MIVVADTSPLNYLVLIGQVHLLPQIYDRVLIPQAVFQELTVASSPLPVKLWLATRPAWLEVSQQKFDFDRSLEHLGKGERDAIALAQSARADRLVVDENVARREASLRGIRIIGVLGILLEASYRDFIDLAETLKALKNTSFFVSEDLIKYLLEEDRRRR